MSADSTLQSGLRRFASTVVGGLLGLLSVHLVGGEGNILLRLVITTAATSAIATVWPSLSYSMVMAVFIALYPDPEVKGALERTIAILIGSSMGIAATFVVWPELGRQQTVRLLCDSLYDCRALLDLTFQGIEKDCKQQRNVIHARFLSHLEAAREAAVKTYLRPHLRSGLALHKVLAATEGLWFGLIVLDRVITDKRSSLGATTTTLFRPIREEVQEVSCLKL